MYANVRNMISSSPWVRYAQMTVRTSNPCEILLSRNQRKVVPTSRQPWQPKSCYTIRNNEGGIAMMNEGIVSLRLCHLRADNENDEYRDVTMKQTSIDHVA